MSRSTRIFAAVIAVMFLVASLCGCQKTGDIYTMRDDLNASDVAAEMGVGINLGNTFEASYSADDNLCSFSSVIGDGEIINYETCWGAIETTREIIDGMRDSGFKCVRVPVYWGNGMENDGSFTVNKKLLKRVEEVVSWVLEDGMYCIINMHHYDEKLITHLEREEAVSVAKTVWEQVAEHFKDYGDHLIFEGYNEYLGAVKEGSSATDQEKFDYCNEMNQVFVDAVRSTGGNNSERILIASGFNTNIDMTSSDGFKMPTDSAKDKLMVSVHYIDNNMYWSKQIGSESWHDYIYYECDKLKESFTDKGIPVFVGETTGGYVGNMVGNSAYGSSQECVQELVRIAREEYGFVTVFWDTNNPDGSSFYSRYSCSVPDKTNAETVKTYG